MSLTEEIIRENFKRRKAQDKYLTLIGEAADSVVPIKLHQDGRPVTPNPIMAPTSMVASTQVVPSTPTQGENQRKGDMEVQVQVERQDQLLDPRLPRKESSEEVFLTLIPWSSYGVEKPQPRTEENGRRQRKRKHRRTRRKQQAEGWALAHAGDNNSG